MKSLIFVTVLTLLFLKGNAQSTNSCRFIGLYNKENKGVCSNRAYIQENIIDYKEFRIRERLFYEEHKKDEPTMVFVAANESIIVYGFQQNVAGWGCTIEVVSYMKGKTIDECEEMLMQQVNKHPRDYKTPPKTLYASGMKSK